MLTSIISQLKDYDSKSFRKDLMAGLTVAIMLVPQGMAYSILAGLPAIYGLYAGLFPLLIYPIFGSSRQLSVGPVALVSIIVFSGLSQIADPFTSEYIQLAIVTALIAGFFQIILATFKMGFLVNFLSHPVISGFTSAAAVIITISQLKHLLGLKLPRSENIYQSVVALIQNIDQASWHALLVGLAGLLVIIVSKKISRKIPGYLIALVLSILAVKYFGLESYVEIIKEVKGGLPAFQMPIFEWKIIKTVIPLSLIICLISFIESMAISKTIAGKHGNYPVHANRELFALGLSKVVSSFFQGFPTSGSFGRSALNDEAGAKTGLSSLWAFVFVLLTLLFFTPYFYYLPQATLAAVVISAVFGLIDWKTAVDLFKKDKRDFLVLIVTFFLTIFLGIFFGIMIGIGISILLILGKVARPHYAVLGKLPNTSIYRNVDRFDEAITDPGYLILRYDDDIFFGNAEHFYDTVIYEVDIRPDISYFILDASSISHLDSTGVEQVRLLHKALTERKIKFLICGRKGPVRDIFKIFGLRELFPSEHLFMDISSAKKFVAK